jgi:hypothetical protein
VGISGRPASHIWMLTSACWLFVATIFTGLLSNYNLIKLRHWIDVSSMVTLFQTQVKLNLLQIPNVMPDLSKLDQIPPLLEATEAPARTNRYTKSASIFGIVAQLAFALAFLMLAGFIQFNITMMLSSK